ncbi:MAG: hypothetical protein ACT4PV_00190 [Planctomycetaceae bacterium]
MRLALFLLATLVHAAGAPADDAEALSRAATLAAEELRIEAEELVAQGRRQEGLDLLLEARRLGEGAGTRRLSIRLELLRRGSARAIARLEETLREGRSEEALAEARWAARILRAWRAGVAEAAVRRERWLHRLAGLTERARLVRRRLAGLR